MRSAGQSSHWLMSIVGAVCVLCLAATMAVAQAGPPGPAPAVSAGPSSVRSGGDTDARSGNATAEFDVALVRGRLEFTLYGPSATMAVADPLLRAEGAQLLRIRPLPGFGAELRIYDFHNRLDLGDARRLLAEAAPGAMLDRNTIYRFAQNAAPRTYAAALLGDSGGGCRVPSAVTIGMIDGPVAASHPALISADIVVLSTLLASDRPVAADHGTAVAGLLVGEDLSGALHGFAPGARLIAVTAFARERGGAGADIDRLAAAFDALTRSGTDVINLSFAGPPNAVLDMLLAETARRGAILVGAAGNTNSDDRLYPAGAGDVIAVTAVDAALRRYRSASFGADVEFSAPGVEIFVAGPGTGGRYASGTSYAAPIVAGLVARLHARGIRSTAAVREVLLATSRDLGVPGRDEETGWGLVSASDC